MAKPTSVKVWVNFGENFPHKILIHDFLFILGKIEYKIMPAQANLRDLEKLQLALSLFKAQNEEAYGYLQQIIRDYRKLGYKNICKLILEEVTPEDLKRD